MHILAKVSIFFAISVGLSCGNHSVFNTGHIQTKDLAVEVTLERTQCFGTCPVYKVVFRNDGSATFIGESFTPLIGTYKGSIQKERFAKLLDLAESQGYFQLQDEYLKGYGGDLPSSRISITKDNKKKTILSYGSNIPKQLEIIQSSIDTEVSNIKWEKDN